MIYDMLERKMLERFFLEPIALAGGLFVVIYDAERGKYLGESLGVREYTENDKKEAAEFFSGSREAYWWLSSRHMDGFNVDKRMISRFDIVPIYDAADHYEPVLRVFDHERGIFIDEEIPGGPEATTANYRMWKAWQNVKEEEERKRRDRLEMESGVW